MPLSADVLVVFALIGLAMALFLTETFSPDVTAIGVIVSLVILQPWTGISSRMAIQGFANPATVTVIGMYILSEGIRRTGVVSRFGYWLRDYAGDGERRLLGALVGSAGVGAGFINNTPIVAVFIPMVTEIADETGISPSKLLLPLSYAAMLGGTLTLIGTATNVLVSEYAQDLLGHPISMFEFTPLGIVVLAVGLVYLLTIGRWLTPARVAHSTSSIESFQLERHLSQLVVKGDSPLVGRSADLLEEAAQRGQFPPVSNDDDGVESSNGGDGATGISNGEDDPSESEMGFDLDVLQLVRNAERILTFDGERSIEAGDVLTVRGNRQEVNRFASTFGLRQLTRKPVTKDDIEPTRKRGRLVEVALPDGSRFVGDTVDEANLAAYHNATVLALRSGDEVVTDGLRDHTLVAGDSILLQVRERDLRYLVENQDVIVVRGVGPTDAKDRTPPELRSDTPLALGILAAVVLSAAVGLLHIAIAALGGVVLMFVFDVLSPKNAYKAVNWNVVFLLAGVIPLGTALRVTGGVDLVAASIVDLAVVLPPLAVLGLFYVLTNLFSNVITPVATVVLLAPVAVDTAARLGFNEFSFLLAILFGASTAFVTPIGYQTNMMVYGPGGYRFTDYVRVGGPLQLLLIVVTTVGIATIWGV